MGVCTNGITRKHWNPVDVGAPLYIELCNPVHLKCARPSAAKIRKAVYGDCQLEGLPRSSFCFSRNRELDHGVDAGHPYGIRT